MAASPRVAASASGAPPAWLGALAGRAPDFVEAYERLEVGGATIAMRRLIRTRAGLGTAAGILAQHEAVAEAYAAHLERLPEAAFRAPGGEEQWNAAQALGHAFDARAGLALASALAARGRFPPDAAAVVPGVPGPPDATREALRHRLAASQRLVARSARDVAGHEAEPCPLDHPLVGHLRCGEWLLFAGIHDLMHLAQLARLAGRLRDHGVADHGAEDHGVADHGAEDYGVADR